MSLETLKWQSRMSTVGEAVEYLFDNPLMSDVTFMFLESDIVKKIHAHSLVLAIRSPLFYDEFHEKIGKSQTIPITEFSHEAFLCFMRYLYGADFATNFQTVMELSNIAEQYKVSCLVNKCDEITSNAELALDSIGEYLELAVKFGNESLKKKAMTFIGEHGRQFMTNDVFNSLSSKTLKEILAREVELEGVSEVDIFNLMIKWAEHQCLLNNCTVNPMNIRQSLGDLIKMVRFTAMSQDEFKECAGMYKAVFSEPEPPVLKIEEDLDVENEFDNGLTHWKTDELNFEQLKDEKMWLGDLQYAWRNCSTTHSRFIVNREIYVTDFMIARPSSSQNVRMTFGEVDGVIIQEETQSVLGSKCLTVPFFTFKKPTLLQRKRLYFFNIQYDNPHEKFVCRPSKTVPFTRTLGNVQLKFNEWCPLFDRFDFKKPSQNNNK